MKCSNPWSTIIYITSFTKFVCNPGQMISKAGQCDYHLCIAIIHLLAKGGSTTKPHNMKLYFYYTQPFKKLVYHQAKKTTLINWVNPNSLKYTEPLTLQIQCIHNLTQYIAILLVFSFWFNCLTVKFLSSIYQSLFNNNKKIMDFQRNKCNSFSLWHKIDFKKLQPRQLSSMMHHLH